MKSCGNAAALSFSYSYDIMAEGDVMFIDYTAIKVLSGKGGDGASTFRRESMSLKGGLTAVTEEGEGTY